jgi:LacI family transcriptional regulator
MTTRATIRDIARLAGVSTATVSRVLNQKPDVDSATRERIVRIMEEQGFMPSVAAAGLAGGRTGLIGMLVPSLTWAFMPAILGGVADIIEQTSYELVLYSLSHKRERSAVIDRIVTSKLIDGLLAVYPDGAARPGDVVREDHRASQHLAGLNERGLAVVIIDDQGEHPQTPWVSPDNRQGAVEAVRYLAGLGHRRIAHITGPAHYLCARDRLDGYRGALLEAGLSFDPGLVVAGDFNSSGGRAAAATLLSRTSPPTAIFAANDGMAYGVLIAAEEHGVRVPQDVAVVGFDDSAPSAHTHPPLTTVQQPFFEMGQRAAETLLALVEAPRPSANGWPNSVAPFTQLAALSLKSKPTHIQLPTRLVVRESCGALRRQVAHAGSA